MTNLVNRWNNKISFGGLLRSPPDDPNLSGTGDDEEVKVNDSDDGKGKNKAPKSDDDLDLGDLVGDDDDDELLIPDDEIDEESEENERKNLETSGTELGKKLLGDLEKFSIDESDIPDDIDFSDKKSIAKFMTASMQKSMKKSLDLMAPVVSHAMRAALTQMQKNVNKTLSQTSKKTKAQEAFESLGYTAKEDKLLAKQIFNTATKRGLSVDQAAKATRNAMKNLGKAGGGKSGGREDNGGTGIQSGDAALNSLFE